MHAQPLARSYLFVPADRPERIAKAHAADADAVIVDLEDAVAPAHKVAARAMLADKLSLTQPVVVRVNGIDSEWFEADVEVCRHPGIVAVVLPKAERPEAIHVLAARLGGTKPILPIIESALGLWNAHALAQVAGVQRLLFGQIDFQLDLGVYGDQQDLSYFRAQLVLVSRVAGLPPPVDGPTTSLKDLDVIQADSLRAKRAGFAGKLCIHPAQVAVVNDCFTPSAEELSWAHRVVTAAAEGGAVAIDGKMIDRPVLALAEFMLSQQRTISTK